MNQIVEIAKIIQRKNKVNRNEIGKTTLQKKEKLTQNKKEKIDKGYLREK